MHDQELLADDRNVLWHAFTQMAHYEPLVIESAAGCVLVDIDGNRYLDGTSSLWCNVHGHRHPKIDAAIRRQLDRVAHVTLLGASHPPAIRLARRLVDLAPGDLSHVFFSSDGASAIEVALKMAYQYWQQRDDPRQKKTRFAALTGAYHGDTIGAMSLGDLAEFHALFRPLLTDAVRIPAPELYRLPAAVASSGALDHYLAEAERTLAEHHESLAALVVEPLVQGAAGMKVQPRGYLRGLRDLTRRYDVLLLADEIAVGIGRTGTMFACEQEDVVPDLLALGKGLSGGYLPMAATLATGELWRAFLDEPSATSSKTLYHGHTFSGNPLGCAAALATLDVFDEEKTLASMRPKVELLSEHLRRIGDLDHVGDVRQCGLMAGIELVEDRQLKTPFPASERRGAEVCRRARSHGVLIRPLGDVIVVMPPLAISTDELAQLCTAVEKSILEMAANVPATMK